MRTGKLKFRRRKYLIDSRFQMRIILVFVIISLLGSIAATAAFNFFAIKELEGIMWSIHIRAQSTGEILKPLFIKIALANFTFISIFLTIMVLWMMRRASGPLYRMSQDIKNASDGDLSVNISLRYNDQFRDTARDLDNMMAALRKKFRTITDHYQDISGQMQNIRRPEDCESVLSQIAHVEKELKKLKV